MEIRTLILLFHLIGLAVGLGAATVSDVMFLRSIRDKKLTNSELSTLKVLSRIVWVGISILILSGLGSFLNQYNALGEVISLSSERFIAKLTLVGVIFINGLVFHFKVFPMFKSYVGKKLSTMKHGDKWLLSVTGAVSATTWYSVLLIAVWRNIPLNYWQIIGVYLAILAAAIVTARIMFAKLLR